MMSLNLLIVDDSEPARRMVKRILKNISAEVYECPDGSEALTAYALYHPDWVFMDIEMKGVDGITATRQITAAFPEAQVVIISNHDGADLRAAASEAGACAYITKDNLIEARRFIAREKS